MQLKYTFIGQIGTVHQVYCVIPNRRIPLSINSSAFFSISISLPSLQKIVGYITSILYFIISYLTIFKSLSTFKAQSFAAFLIFSPIINEISSMCLAESLQCPQLLFVGPANFCCSIFSWTCVSNFSTTRVAI
ncbi:uncharacterized protein LOC132303681 [Cornus florida]|uniref:uncharacterized protein LOC132303681 n=1 Tax=Cornus florida TaxID=4283 RepID=UPI00289CD8A6|nr:uncharacterized protein LOC132303681 [Cornus florida]XP_059657025.1 uncharacterized protein LOC132303681 [Cornus florida]